MYHDVEILQRCMEHSDVCVIFIMQDARHKQTLLYKWLENSVFELHRWSPSQ